MSTLPHATSSRTNPALLVTTQYSEEDLDAVVREFESVANEVGIACPSAPELRDLCRQVAQVSQRLFPGDVKLTVGRDWGIPDWIYFVVDVWTSGTPDEVIAQIREWNLTVHRIEGKGRELFCLAFRAR
jgi:hypothetical protein